MQERLKIHPLASQVLIDCAESVEDEFELAVEAESAGSVEDVGYIAVSAIVAVEVEHLEEVLAVFFGKDWILGDDLPGEDSLAVLFCQFLATVHHLNGYNVIATMQGRH